MILIFKPCEKWGIWNEDKYLLTIYFSDSSFYLFTYILIDNGNWFSNPQAIEYCEHLIRGGTKHRTNIFYCHAGCHYKKEADEVDHELIRWVIPKETSMDDLTQKDFFLMMNHIYSYKKAEQS